MAKRKPHDPYAGPSAKERRRYEVEDGYHAIRRAQKIVGDKKLMGEIKAHAHTLAKEHKVTAHHIGMLAKTGRISPKQMTKLTKNRPLA